MSSQSADDTVRVFLSYAREDENRVSPIYDRLVEEGLSPWMDRTNLFGGEQWKSIILKQIRGSHFFLACLSSNAVDKRGFLQVEIKEAFDVWKEKLPGDIYLIPVRLKDCEVPEVLHPFYWVNFFEADGWSRLMRSIHAGVERLGMSVAGVEPEILTVCKPILPELIRIPAGEFLIGDDKKPTHVDEFYIGKYPITNEQYAPFVRAGGTAPRHWESGRIPPGKQDHPVVWVSWNDAVAYCEWLSKKTGREFRLPTEEEWEKAARGTDGRTWPWGDRFDQNKCNTEASGIGTTTPVGAYSSKGGDSPYGVADMAGNVSEWTGSLWGEGSTNRVIRGGAFGLGEVSVRCAARSWVVPLHLYGYFGYLGFRVAASPSRP